MAHSYRFAVVRLAPDDGRGEQLNIGVIVLKADGIDVRISKRLEKTRAMSAALDTALLRELLDSLAGLDARSLELGVSEAGARLKRIARIGPLLLSEPGTFEAFDESAYEERIGSIFKALVEPEPATKISREKRSKLLTQVKATFRQERVLAKRDETLDSHRILSGYELDEGLVADLVLRNGAMHVVETVDASSDAESPRKAVAEIGVAALVLERARMKFGDSTKARLVYVASGPLERVAMPSLEAAQHQGAELIDWANAVDRGKFVHALASMAMPIPRKRRGRVVSFEQRRFDVT
jgi:hypothetical protein